MRRWLPALTAAVIAAVLTLSLIAPERLPAPLLRLYAGDVGPRSSAMIVNGGEVVELEVQTHPTDTGAGLEHLARRLAGAGFEIDFVGVDRIFASYPGDDPVQVAVARSGVYWPFAIARVGPGLHGYKQVRAGEVVAGDAIASVDTHDGVTEVRLVDPKRLRWLASGLRDGESLAIVEVGALRHGALPMSDAGRAVDGALRFERFDDPRPFPDHLEPSAGTLFMVDHDHLGPAVTESDTWSARGVLAGLVGLAVFALFAVASRRRRLRELVARDDTGAGRVGVAAAALVTIAVIGVGLLRGEPGPFMASIQAGLLGVAIEAVPLDLGYFVVVCGFTAAMVLTLAVPRWRRDLVWDNKRGARLLRRGLILTAVSAALLLLAPQVDDRLDVILEMAEPTNPTLFALSAIGLVAVVFAAASRAIGGAWVCAPLAVLLPACVQLCRELVKAQDAATIGTIGASAVGGVAIAIAGVCAATATVLSLRFGDRETSLRAPVGGVLPLAIGVGIAVVFSVWWLDELPTARHAAVQVGIALPLVVAAALFELRIRRGLGGARVSRLARHGRSGEVAAVVISIAFTGGLLAVDLASRQLRIVTFAVLSALTCAALMDVASELRARWRRPTLTPVWHIHQPQLAGVIERALESRGLACHMRAQYLRTCLGIFGAFVPIAVLVDRSRSGEARELVATLLAPEQTAASGC